MAEGGGGGRHCRAPKPSAYGVALGANPLSHRLGLGGRRAARCGRRHGSVKAGAIWPARQAEELPGALNVSVDEGRCSERGIERNNGNQTRGGGQQARHGLASFPFQSPKLP